MTAPSQPKNPAFLLHGLVKFELISIHSSSFTRVQTSSLKSSLKCSKIHYSLKIKVGSFACESHMSPPKENLSDAKAFGQDLSKKKKKRKSKSYIEIRQVMVSH